MEEIDPNNVESLTELIKRLNSQTRLSADEKDLKFKKYFKGVFSHMIDHSTTYGEESGAPGMALYPWRKVDCCPKKKIPKSLLYLVKVRARLKSNGLCVPGRPGIRFTCAQTWKN